MEKSETLIATSSEPLKALETVDSLVRVGSYAIRFSSPDEKDLVGEYFTKDTDFGTNKGDGAMCLFNHGVPVAKGLEALADKVFSACKAMVDEVGVFMETCLDLADEYEKAVYDLVQAGKLKWSTGSASHVVKKAPDGMILRWPIVEASFTPMACEPRLPAIAPLKSLSITKEVGEEVAKAFGKSAVVDTQKRGMSETASPTQAEIQAQIDAEAQKRFEARSEAEFEKREQANESRKSAIMALGKQFEKFGGVELAEKACKSLKTTVDEFRKTLTDSFDPAAIVTPPAERKGSGIEVGEDRSRVAKSIGQHLVESEAFKSFAKSGIRNHGTLIADIPGSGATKATLLTTTGPFTNPDIQPGVIELNQRRLTVRDLLSAGQTTAGQIKYTREDSFTTAATSVAEEGLKPEASFDLSQITSDVSKIAVIGRVSKESFDDFPFLQTYVDNRLRYMVKLEEERELLSGDGSGEDLTGLLATSGIQTQSGATDPLDAVLKAITKVRNTGYFEPDGIVVNPTDYQTFRLTKDANGQYLGGGPFMGQYGNGGVMMQPPIWGLPVVVTSAIAQGTLLVGAFKPGATIFDREGLRVDTTDTDGNDWRYNRIAIRLEERLALAVWRPLAFCEVTGIA